MRPANVGEDAMTAEDRRREHERALKRCGIKPKKEKKENKEKK